MRLKTLPLAVLLLPLLTRTSFAQTPPESPEGQSGAYGIESEQSYPGALVLELLEAAEAEIDAAVAEAYAEGYKAAALRYAPEAAVYKTEVEALKKELEAGRRKARFFWPAAGVSFVLGFLSRSLAGR